MRAARIPVPGSSSSFSSDSLPMTIRLTPFRCSRVASGRVARFKDQIVTTNMSAGGDSGSLVLTIDNVAVGLLFAGSSTSMIANQIENVRSRLRVEVAEQIL